MSIADPMMRMCLFLLVLLQWIAMDSLSFPAAAQENDVQVLTEQVREAGALCRKGDLHAATELLWQLHTTATLRYGHGHAVTRYFELNLDKVAAARGPDGPR